MKKIKNVSLWCLICSMFFSVFTYRDVQAQEMENVAVNEERDAYPIVFQVSENSLEQKVEEYDIPKEVKEYIETVFEKNENASIEVYAPGEIANTRGSSGSWSSTRVYKGYTLRDWNVHVTNAFGMTRIRTGTTAASFADAVLGYAGGVVLDRIIPFGSATVTLVQFMYGNSSSVSAMSGDKMDASPKFTADTKFTYVTIGGEELLGARTHKAKLETVTWYYYSQELHKDLTKEYTYNRTMKTTNYDSPDAKAIVSTGIGGYLEGPIKYKIGNVTFNLE